MPSFVYNHGVATIITNAFTEFKVDQDYYGKTMIGFKHADMVYPEYGMTRLGPENWAYFPVELLDLIPA